MPPAVGIDLGTTTSCIGIYRDDQFEIIPNEDGDHTTPSWVAFTENGRLIGASAKGQAALNPTNTIFDAKRLLGRRYDDPQVLSETRRLPFEIVDELGRPAVQVMFKGQKTTFLPEEISAMILSKLKQIAQKYLHLDRDSDLNCVMCVPSTFNSYQHQAVMNACYMAGLPVLRIVSEPSAAAFAFDYLSGSFRHVAELCDDGRPIWFRNGRIDGKDDGCICLVFDIGGGTVGATLLLLEDSVSEVLATAGSDHLGGEDFDDRLADYLADIFESTTSASRTRIKTDARAMSRLRAAAERAKRVLSSAMTTKVEVESLSGGKDLSVTVTRTEFENCCMDLFKSTTRILDQVLRPIRINSRLDTFFNRDTGALDPKCIDEIVLAGGSSRIPKVQEIVSEYFSGKELNRSINPDEAATIGASIQASILSGDTSSQVPKDMLLLDVLPMSVRVEHDGPGPSGGTLLLAKNTCIPNYAQERFAFRFPRRPGQANTPLQFSFYEGDEELLSDNIFLCKLEIPEPERSLVSGPTPDEDYVSVLIDVRIHANHRHDIEFFVTDVRSKKCVSKVLDRSINPLSADALDQKKAYMYEMLNDDGIDAQRAVLKSTLESEAYNLEDRASGLRSVGSITQVQAEHLRASIQKILSWLERSPRSELDEYEAQLGELEILSELVSSMVNMNGFHEAQTKVKKVIRSPSPIQTPNFEVFVEPPARPQPVVAQEPPDKVDLVRGKDSTLAVSTAPHDDYSTVETKISISKADEEFINTLPEDIKNEIFLHERGELQPRGATEIPLSSVVEEKSLVEPVSEVKSTQSTVEYPVISQAELKVAYPALDDPSDQSGPNLSRSPPTPDLAPPIIILPYRENSSPLPSDDFSQEFANTSFASIETRLGMYFTDQDGQVREKYTDKDLRTIALLLQSTGRRTWSTVPRIYTVLRRIGQHQLLDDFIDLGITDIWLPISASSLPDKLSPSIRSSFVDTQPMVLTAALEMEKERQHAHFGRDDPVPYEPVADLGSGGYGHVEKVVSLLSHREFARKKFRRKRGFSKANEVFKGFKNELAILKRMSHIHCVELVCSYTDPKYIALIMDPVADFNLAAYYIEAAQSREKLAQLRRFYGCLANALKYLHESKIRHRDIKPENILIKGPKVLLTDFGLSFDWEHLPHSTTTADLPKTAVYAAPEVANYERKKNSASDIWSLGCVFLEMVTVLKGETVLHMREFFRERTDNYLFHANMSGAKVWTHKLSKLGLEEDGIPVEWVANMLNRDPSKRPTAASLFSEILDCDTTVKFCGHCCENQETDESDDSEDDHDPLADTMQEMTVKPR